jgi:PhzF family phenazine biosynthesis protein
MTLYQIDAFTDRLFGGNPAAVLPLTQWLDDATLQAIAQENNLAETAFFVPQPEGYHLRWFTPAQEVDLCGHATLAAAYVLYQCLGATEPRLTFHTRSGPLHVGRNGQWLTMDFPARPAEACPEALAALTEALGAAPDWVGKSRDYLAVFPDEAIVRALRPDMAKVAALDCLGVIATAAGEQVDFVSRFFAPQAGVPEDPVTGSAHCTLVPYWAKRLGRAQLQARQVSTRGGDLHCVDQGSRVSLAGQARLYFQGEIALP